MPIGRRRRRLHLARLARDPHAPPTIRTARRPSERGQPREAKGGEAQPTRSPQSSKPAAQGVAAMHGVGETHAIAATQRIVAAHGTRPCDLLGPRLSARCAADASCSPLRGEFERTLYKRGWGGIAASGARAEHSRRQFTWRRVAPPCAEKANIGMHLGWVLYSRADRCLDVAASALRGSIDTYHRFNVPASALGRNSSTNSPGNGRNQSEFREQVQDLLEIRRGRCCCGSRSNLPDFGQAGSGAATSAATSNSVLLLHVCK